MLSGSGDLVIGILALQGDFEAHRKMFEEKLGVTTRLVRSAEDMKGIAGLILPGGESTTMGKLMERFGIDSAIRERASSGMPIFGTCAGLILLASDVESSNQLRLGLLDVTVARNAFGRQLDSFEADIPVNDLAGESVRGVFIRAPYVKRAGSGVQILGEYQGRIVAVRQGGVLGIAFHPELTDDTRMHAEFVRMVAEFAASSPSIP